MKLALMREGGPRVTSAAEGESIRMTRLRNQEVTAAQIRGADASQHQLSGGDCVNQRRHYWGRRREHLWDVRVLVPPVETQKRWADGDAWRRRRCDGMGAHLISIAPWAFCSVIWFERVSGKPFQVVTSCSWVKAKESQILNKSGFT